MDQEKAKRSKDTFSAFVLSCEFVLLIFILYLWIVTELWGFPENVGIFGDQFGGATALFSGFAFAGLISTLIMQRDELGYQREELALTRTEFNLQRFENTLFGLIRLLNEHVASMERSWNSTSHGSVVVNSIRGREYIRDVVGDFPDQIYKDRQYVFTGNEPVPHPKQRTLDEQFKIYREKFDSQLEPDFAPYMRLLYGIFRHIEMSSIHEDQKKMYSRIARAHLSSAELKFILFDCADGVGVDFKGWIAKYGILKHLPDNVKKANPDLVTCYALASFEPIAIPHTKL